MTRYRTIVADPPWEIGDFPPNFGYEAGKACPYRTMSVEEISALPVASLSNNLGADAHLYLWTTGQFLEAAFGVVRAWGFQYVATLVWCKPAHGVGLGGTWPANVEFVLFGRRPQYRDAPDSLAVTRWLRARLRASGITRRELMERGGFTEGQLVHWLAGTLAVGPNVPSLDAWERLRAVVGFGHEMDAEVARLNAMKGTAPHVPLARAPGRWFEWPRGKHSAKPEAFLDLVEQVSPGPYVELFARRDRLGWDTWGNESLGTATMEAA